MIRIYICCSERQEIVIVAGAARQLLRQQGNGEKPVCVFRPEELQKELLAAEEDQMNIVVCDVCESDAIPVLEKIRAGRPDMKLILMADGTVSPTVYIRPTIMPSALLWRPATEQESKRVLTEVLSAIHQEKPSDLHSEEEFQIEVRGVIRRFSCHEILYFEAREKKLWLHLSHRELAFPGTLEKLQSELPAGFLRVHKSFIVNCAHAMEIQYGQNMMLLTSGEMLPISRSYKADVKAVFS